MPTVPEPDHVVPPGGLFWTKCHKKDIIFVMRAFCRLSGWFECKKRFESSVKDLCEESQGEVLYNSRAECVPSPKGVLCHRERRARDRHGYVSAWTREGFRSNRGPVGPITRALNSRHEEACAAGARPYGGWERGRRGLARNHTGAFLLVRCHVS